MPPLSQKNLQSALKTNKNYKQVQPFLDSIAEGNAQTIQIVSDVFNEILNSQKVELLQKLLVLRLYKDIFILGNMQMFDLIDSSVHHSVVSAASFNPTFQTKSNSKETRGAMYFTQTENRAKNDKNFQFSHSFVTLATQIIQHFSRWYPEDESGNESNFTIIFKKLHEMGVTFDTNVYFKAEQKEEFEQNYKEWKLKNEKKGKKGVKENKKMREDQTNQNVEQMFHQRLMVQKSRWEEQKSNQITKLEEQIEIKRRVNEQLKQQIKENQRCRQNLQNELNVLKAKQNENLSHESDQKQLMQKLSQQMRIAFEQNMSLNAYKTEITQKITQLQNQNKELLSQIKQYKAQNEGQAEDSKYKQKYRKSQLESNLKELKEIISQNQKQIQSETLQKRECQTQLAHVSEQKYQLEVKLKDLQEKYSILLQQKHKLQQLHQTSQPQLQPDACLILSQPCQQQPNITISYHQINPTSEIPHRHSLHKTRDGSISMSKLLGLKSPSQFQKQNTKNVEHDDKPYQNRKASNSMSKTQLPKYKSHDRLASTFNTRWARQTSNMGTTNNPGLYRTENGFKKTLVIKKKDVSATVFPFLEEYFSPIIINESSHFRACSISQKARQSPIFSDEFLDFYFILRSQSINPKDSFQLAIKNKTAQTSEIKVSLQTPQIFIKNSDFTRKIYPQSESSFEIEANVSNMNFRFATFIVKMFNGFQQRKYQIPVPFTLLNSTKLSQNQKQIAKFQRFEDGSYKFFKSEKFFINKIIKTLPLAFPQLRFQYSSNGSLQAMALMTYPQIPQIKAKVKLIENQNQCEIETKFLSESKFSEAFAKVMIQVFMFVLIEKRA